jgi:hypothetical protein
MEIYTTTKTYLVINKLDNEDKETLKKNIEPMNYFCLVPDGGVLICSNSDTTVVIDALTKDIKELGRITILQLNASLLGKGKVIDGFEYQTVFDK